MSGSLCNLHTNKHYCELFRGAWCELALRPSKGVTGVPHLLPNTCSHQVRENWAEAIWGAQRPGDNYEDEETAQQSQHPVAAARLPLLQAVTDPPTMLQTFQRSHSLRLTQGV